MRPRRFYFFIGVAVGLACAAAPTSLAAPEADALTCSSGERRWVAEALNVVDGDTYDLRIDLVLNVYRVERIRLLGVDTPEVRGDEKKAGLEAAKVAQEFFESCPCSVVSAGKRGK